MPETVEVPGSWRSASDTNAVIAAWWTTFHAPQLVAVVNEAMVRNHDLQAALARMEAAAADARMAGADLYPRLDGGFDASRSRRNFIGFPIPGSGGNVLSTENNSFGLILSTSWEVDLWGRIRSGRRAALADLQASQADYFALRQSIAAQAVKGWLAVVEQQRQVALSEQTAQAFERTARLIERRYERGLASSLDFRLARTDLESSRASLADRRALRERAVRQLQLLLGRYPDGLTEVQVEFPDLAREIPAGLPSELLARRPDIIAAERRLASAVSRVKQARAALYPRLSLTASGGTSTDDLGELLNTDFSVWTLAANAAQPILQGGRIVAGIDLAKARNRQAVAEYGRAILRAFTEVETALSVEGKLADRERHLAAAVREARASFAQAEERYLAGIESVLAVLQAQRNYFNAESQLISVQRVRLDNRVDLHLALGGGYALPDVHSIPGVDEPAKQLSQTR